MHINAYIHAHTYRGLLSYLAQSSTFLHRGRVYIFYLDSDSDMYVLCMCVCINTCMYVYKVMYVCIHVCMYTCMYVCMCVCLLKFAFFTVIFLYMLPVQCVSFLKINSGYIHQLVVNP